MLKQVVRLSASTGKMKTTKRAGSKTQRINRFAVLACIAFSSLPIGWSYRVLAKPFLPVSLDDKLPELKEAGSLSALCSQNKGIRECEIAIGEWKPKELENAKGMAAICFDQCLLDIFGFYRDTNSGRDIPAVRTKDFDGAAPSRGFEITFYPVALKVFRYEGCAGCELIYQYPIKLNAIYGQEKFELPMLSRGGYYMPSSLRKSIALDPNKELSLKALIGEGEFTVKISNKAVREYSRLLTVLKYNEVH